MLIFSFLLASFLTVRAVSPAARLGTPTTPTATSPPIATNDDAAKHTPTLAARCDGGGACSFGGTKETLQANTVTTTIVSTTSVPCYITTYITDSTTTTATVYSTDTITSTVTEEGTVYVYKFSPTPYLASSTYESVLQITETMTTFWEETSGSTYESTSTGGIVTVGGGGSDSGDGRPQIPASSLQQTGNAWTHVAASDNSDIQTIGGGGQALTTGTANGWAASAGGTVVAATKTGSAVGAMGVTWSGSHWTVRPDWPFVTLVSGAVCTLLSLKLVLL